MKKSQDIFSNQEESIATTYFKYKPICCCITVSGHRFFPNFDCNFTWCLSTLSVTSIAVATDGLCLIAYIKFPNLHEQYQLQQSFLKKCGFPLVLGCIDCSHVSIVATSNNEVMCVNRKNIHSINIQAICDSDLKFIDVVAKWPVSTHDAYIWRQSGINQRITSGDIPTVQGWFLGDSGYPLRLNLLTPILNPNTPRERRYIVRFSNRENN